ncbi:MAG: DinB family protein [Bacteroidota bacterium]
MENVKLKGNVRALLDEYRRAIDDLIQVISPVTTQQLTAIADAETEDPDCRSIQTVLTHVVNSGYGYTITIENHSGASKPYTERTTLENAGQYIEKLNLMFEYCRTFFMENPDLEIEETDCEKKITVRWGQQYDIEQLMEHSIVHILRHRRQIESFIRKLT